MPQALPVLSFQSIRTGLRQVGFLFVWSGRAAGTNTRSQAENSLSRYLYLLPHLPRKKREPAKKRAPFSRRRWCRSGDFDCLIRQASSNKYPRQAKKACHDICCCCPTSPGPALITTS
jgi:hypothetical protein